MSYVNGSATRELLLVTAERLFAQRGIDAVSLREIGEVAGQKNTAVSHYYFGDKEGLVQAIFEFRAAEVRDRRQELVDELLGQPSVRGAVEVFILPMAEQLSRPGSHYIGFIARLDTDHHRSRILASPSSIATLNAAFDVIASLCGHVDRALLRSRWALVARMAIHALADRQVAPLDAEAQRVPYRRWLEDLVNVSVAIMEAPPPRRPTKTRTKSGRAMAGR
jgi:AcrR family transcriptional regulator